jgi:ABC-type phosphate/phosphonate transport system substrate-binding protein
MLGTALFGGCALASGAAFADLGSEGLTVVVMDPLAAELSCPCVEGYAQRNYRKLGAFLEKELGRTVAMVFADSLPGALKKSGGRADLVIGKNSFVRHDAARAERKLTCVAALTGQDGQTTQTGLVVVLDKDAARSVSDLTNHQLLLGPSEAEERNDAARALLTKNAITLPAKPKTHDTCSEAALALVEGSAGDKAAAFISSYCLPLLEGCGTVRKGELRVIGKTEPVSFITVSVADAMPMRQREAVVKALLAVRNDAALCKALETRNGFVAADADGKKKS